MQAIKNALSGHKHHHNSPHHSSHTAVGDAERAGVATTGAATAGVATTETAAARTSSAVAPEGVVRAEAPVERTSTVGATEISVPSQLDAQIVETDATRVETVVKPEVVHETAHQVEEEIIKPVVERDREQTEIHQIVQPVLDRQVNDTTYSEQTDAVENRLFKEEMSQEDRALYQRNAGITNESTNIGTEHTTVVQPTEVKERIHSRVIEEIQPVIEREVINPSIISHVKPVYEKVIHAPTISSEVRAPIMASAIGLTGNTIDHSRLTSGATGDSLVREKGVGLAGSSPAVGIAREE